MNNRIRTLGSILAALCFLAGFKSIPEDISNEIEFEEFLSSDSPFNQFSRELPPKRIHIGDLRKVVIRDANEWDALWNAYKNPREIPPEIDFTKNMLLGVFLGMQPIIERPKIFFTSVKKLSGTGCIEASYTIVPYKPTWPGVTLPSFAALYTIVIVPISDLQVRFIENKIDELE